MLKWVWNKELSTFASPDDPISLRKAGEVFKAASVPADVIVPAQRADRIELARAHSLRYVEEVLDGVLANGFGNALPLVTAHAMAATGVMQAAVLLALDEARGPSPAVVCAPVSGFHHAHYASAEGFCTFNGILSAILNARVTRPGSLPNVLIIDGDAHYGNGTDDIIRRLGLAGITNLTHDAPLGYPRDPDILEMQILTKYKWDLVIYQAGADAHKDDPYGSGYLNDDDWEARDRLVFQYCRLKDFPLVFNFAGGYNGEKTIDLHCRTVRTARDIYRTPKG